MKKQIMMIALGALALGGCQKEVPPVYDGATGVVYFTYGVGQEYTNLIGTDEEFGIEDSTEISFTQVIDPYTITMKVDIRGYVDYENDRTFTVRILTDAPSDPEYVVAAEDEYQIGGDMVVPAGENFGYFDVTITRSPRIIAGTKVELALELVPSEDFPIVGRESGGVVEEDDNNKTLYKIKYSSSYSEPPIWRFSQTPVYFGAYSPDKYRLLLDACIETFGSPDAVEWGRSSFSAMDFPIATLKYLKSVAAVKLEEYKILNGQDPVTYPPLYYTGTTDWISFPA